ncbi:MAG: ribonuclease III [Planctomycetota bacterium]|jgi:ribonuclease-3
MDEETLVQIERLINYNFSNRNILSKALAHSSSVDNRLLSNERLEFLGDAVLDLVICQVLFDRFPTHLEGDLTKTKSMLVSRRTCSKVARNLGLHKYLLVGKGMTSIRALSGSLSAGVLESIIAAIYIDGGFEAAREFIIRNYSPLIDQTNDEKAHGNFKSLLQQYAQQHFEVLPTYELLDEKGPDHNKCFEVEVAIADHHFPSAWGINKKEAEQKAALNALIELGVIEEVLPEHKD